MRIGKSKMVAAGLLLATLACKKVEMDSNIPNMKVYFETEYYQYTKLHGVGSYMIFKPGEGLYATNTCLGFGGLVIFRDFDNKVRCCDLACPVEANRNILLEINSALQATCKECGSKFDMAWGLCTPVEGPAKETMKIYPHTIDNGTCIKVSN